MRPIGSQALVVGAIAIAMSPALHDLGVHWAANPWTRYSAGFALLLVVCAWHEGRVQPRPRLAAGLVVGALVVQVFALLAARSEWARLGIPLAASGALVVIGRGAPRLLVQTAFLVPVPSSIARALGGEALAMRILSAWADAFGLAVALGHHVVIAAGASLVLEPASGGLPLVVEMVGLGGYAGLRLRLSMRRTALVCGVMGASAIPLQLGVLGGALLMLADGSEHAAKALLETWSWLLPLLATVFVVEKRAGARRGA